MRRFLVRLLVLMVVPVVWIGYHAPAAQAAYSGAASGNFVTSEDTIGWDDVKCSVKGTWNVSALSYGIQGQVLCDTDSNVASAEVTLMTGSGLTCPLPSAPAGEVDGVESVPFTMSTLSALPANADVACNVDSLCYSVSIQRHTDAFFGRHTKTGCFDFPLGPPPDAELPGPPGTCKYGDVLSSSVTITPRPDLGPFREWQAGFSFTRTEQGAGKSLMWMYVVRFSSGSLGMLRVAGNGTNGAQLLEQGHTGGSPFVSAKSQMRTDLASQPVPIGLVVAFDSQEFGWRSSGAPPALNTVPPAGGLGVTNKGACLWYFGEKIASDAAVDALKAQYPIHSTHATGTPAGGIGGDSTPPPDDTDPPDTTPDPISGGDPCEFNLTNPTTWVSAGVCQLVRLMAALIDTVTKLPGRIASAIGALFVPEDGFFEEKGDQLATAWDDTAPGAWVGAIKDQSISVPSGGCNGLHVEWTMAGKTSSFDLLKACDGFMATAASVVKIAATGFLVLFGALGCIRAVGSGFGWNPGVGRGGGSS